MRNAMAGLMLLAVGCGFAPKVVHLEPIAPAAATVGAARLASSPCLTVAPFVDARGQRERIGVNRNGLGMEMGEVRTYGDVAAWIRDHLVHGLAAAGACVRPGEELVLEGRVEEVFVDEYWDLDGRIAVTLTLSRAGRPLLSQRFVGRHAQTSWAASESEFTDTLFQTLLDLGAHALPALVATIDAQATVGAGAGPPVGAALSR